MSASRLLQFTWDDEIGGEGRHRGPKRLLAVLTLLAQVLT